MNFTKAETKVLNSIKKLGASFSSAGMIASDLNLKVQTIKNHLKNLEAKGAIEKTECTFHENTFVYCITKDIMFYLS